jgi:hypothetical protein
MIKQNLRYGKYIVSALSTVGFAVILAEVALPAGGD